MFQRGPYFLRVVRFNAGVRMARIPPVSQLVQRVVVVAREVMLLNRAALQPFEIVFLDGFGSASSSWVASSSAYTASASTFYAFRFHILIQSLNYNMKII
jgi:hypothetical protein